MAQTSRSSPAIGGAVPTQCRLWEVPIRVLVADDQRMFREGIRTRLESKRDIQVVGEAGSGEETLAQVKIKRPTVVILDIRLPPMCLGSKWRGRYGGSGPICGFLC